MAQWEYVKGSEADFREAPEWATVVIKSPGTERLSFEEDVRTVRGNRWKYVSDKETLEYANCSGNRFKNIIAERRKVDDLQSRVNDANLQQFVKVETRAPSKEESDAYNKRFDTVQRPAHYNQSGIECIDAIAASMTPVEFQAYLKGNVQKYLWRYQHKNGVEDCRKAQWYLDRLVKELSK